MMLIFNLPPGSSHAPFYWEEDKSPFARSCKPKMLCDLSLEAADLQYLYENLFYSSKLPLPPQNSKVLYIVAIIYLNIVCSPYGQSAVGRPLELE